MEVNCKLNLFFIYFSHRSKRYRDRKKLEKLKASEKRNTNDVKIPKLSPLKVNLHIKSNFSEVQKLLTNKPTTAVAILRHVWDQEYKDPAKCALMNKYWKCTEDSLAKLMLELGTHKGRKDDNKLLSTVNKIKKKYNSLRQACRLADISWTKLHRHTYIKSGVRRKIAYNRKLTSSQIQEIQSHYNSDEISFPLPGKRFMRASITKSHQMYNLLASTTCKISAATYHKYKPRTVKLQGRIPFQQSCCEKCKNFENANAEASKYLRSVPRNIGDCIDQTLCPYTGFFPKITCILRNCDNCGIAKFKSVILASNQDKIRDTRKRFLVKVWITKTERKSGKVATFVHWKFNCCNYLGLMDLLLNQASSMAEHSFMASWNYWQYKLAKRNIIEGDIILVHDFAQNYLCKHQREIQGLHWHHEEVTIMPTVVHHICATCKGMVTHEIVHVSDDTRHDGHLVKAFTERSEKVLKQNKVPICKIIEILWLCIIFQLMLHRG